MEGLQLQAWITAVFDEHALLMLDFWADVSKALHVNGKAVEPLVATWSSICSNLNCSQPATTAAA